MKPLLSDDSNYAAKYFQWCILETLPLKILEDQAIDRESLYKRKFGTREFGYNNNSSLVTICDNENNLY